jgi:hypothetical protein
MEEEKREEVKGRNTMNEYYEKRMFLNEIGKKNVESFVKNSRNNDLSHGNSSIYPNSTI